MTSREARGMRSAEPDGTGRPPRPVSRVPLLFLGVDPGTAVTGYGLVRDAGRGSGPRLVECGVVRTSPNTPLAGRLREVHDGIADVIERHHPDVMAVEDVFYSRNVRTTITLGHARGVVLLAGERAGLPIHEFPPAEVKKAVTGTGNATKEQVQFMLTRLLRLTSAPQPADAADGVAVALACLQSRHLWNTQPHARECPRVIDVTIVNGERSGAGDRRAAESDATDGERSRAGARRPAESDATDGERSRAGARRAAAGAIK